MQDRGRLLELALKGLQAERAKIDDEIAEHAEHVAHGLEQKFPRMTGQRAAEKTPDQPAGAIADRRTPLLSGSPSPSRQSARVGHRRFPAAGSRAKVSLEDAAGSGCAGQGS